MTVKKNFDFDIMILRAHSVECPLFCLLDRLEEYTFDYRQYRELEKASVLSLGSAEAVQDEQICVFC